MEHDAQHRTNKTKIENEKDFYQTPIEMTHALLLYMKLKDISETSNILDPCSGHGAIVKELKRYYNNVNYIDKYTEKDIHKIDFLEYEGAPDVIIMNPPYSNKYEFIDNALQIAPKVFCLLPLQIMNYNIFHTKYMNIPQFGGKIVMTPKVRLHSGIDIKYGGMSSYAWFYWDTFIKKRPLPITTTETYFNLRTVLWTRALIEMCKIQ